MSQNFTSISLTISGLEERQKDLLKKRKQISVNIEEMQHYPKYGNKIIKRNYQDQHEHQIQKKIKGEEGQEYSAQKKQISSAININSNRTRASHQYYDQTIIEAEQEEKEKSKMEEKTQQNFPKKIQQRNLKMFSQLCNHLTVAKKKLQKEKPLFEKQSEATHKATEKLEQEMEKLKEEQRQEQQQKRRKEIEQKREIQIQLDKLDHEILFSLVQKGRTAFNITSKFYLNKVTFATIFITINRKEPHIFWQPAKTKENLDNLLEENKQELIAKKDGLLAKFQEQQNEKWNFAQKDNEPEEKNEESFSEKRKQRRKKSDSDRENDDLGWDEKIEEQQNEQKQDNEEIAAAQEPEAQELNN